MIPKVIVQYWDQETIPSDVSSLMGSWRNVNSSYEYKLFDNSSARDFISSFYGEGGLEVFDSANVPAMRSDIFRVAYILQCGGIYIDAATLAVSDISLAILSADHLHLLRKKWHSRIWNGFIAAPPKNPIVRKIWEQIRRNVHDRNSNNVWAVTGPGVFIEIAENSLARGDQLTIIKQSDMKFIFNIVNDLEHKKNNHWSIVQKNKSIFRSALDCYAAGREDNVIAVNSIRKVILHLGPHKTGTTSFQNILEDNEGRLLSAGYSLITVRAGCSGVYKTWRNEYTKTIQGCLLGKTSKEETSAGLIKLFADLEGLCSNNSSDCLIISDENLLGPVSGHYYAGGLGREISFYSAHQLVFSAIKEAFKEKDLQVLVCRREFSDFITSAYRDFVIKLTFSETPSRFVSLLDTKIKNQFEDFYAKFQSVFSDSARVISFTDFVSDMGNLISEMSGVELQKTLVASNPSIGWRAVELALEIIPLLCSDRERIAFSHFLANRIDGGSDRIEGEMLEALGRFN